MHRCCVSNRLQRLRGFFHSSQEITDADRAGSHHIRFGRLSIFAYRQIHDFFHRLSCHPGFQSFCLLMPFLADGAGFDHAVTFALFLFCRTGCILLGISQSFVAEGTAVLSGIQRNIDYLAHVIQNKGSDCRIDFNRAFLICLGIVRFQTRDTGNTSLPSSRRFRGSRRFCGWSHGRFWFILGSTAGKQRQRSRDRKQFFHRVFPSFRA